MRSTTFKIVVFFVATESSDNVRNKLKFSRRMNCSSFTILQVTTMFLRNHFLTLELKGIESWKRKIFTTKDPYILTGEK